MMVERTKGSPFDACWDGSARSMTLDAEFEVRRTFKSLYHEAELAISLLSRRKYSEAAASCIRSMLRYYPSDMWEQVPQIRDDLSRSADLLTT